MTRIPGESYSPRKATPWKLREFVVAERIAAVDKLNAVLGEEGPADRVVTRCNGRGSPGSVAAPEIVITVSHVSIGFSLNPNG
jgi:hypothetical protein